MGQIIKVEPAYCLNPGVTVTENGVMISAVFRGNTPCGLILYSRRDSEEIRIPFTDAYRFGSLYSVMISCIDPADWCYRLYCGDKSFADPCCRSLLEIERGGSKFHAGGFFYETDQRLPAYEGRCCKRGGETVIYALHVRGFTMLADDITSTPGTFSAAAEKADYLKDLGITAVELMPVYELAPVTIAKATPLTMKDALALYPVNKKGRPVRDLSVSKINYWGYGRGFYYAPKAQYSTPGYEGGPQKEFFDMIAKFHKAGICVYLQLYFAHSVTIQQQLDIARFYVTHYFVDGFHLMGAVSDIKAFSADPLLSDVRLFYSQFPYGEIEEMETGDPEGGKLSTANLFDHNNRFSTLIRRFCKSDDYVMREFLYEFLKVPSEHGNVHYVCGTDGFTLRDLVSYNEKHNEPNGEGGNDGDPDNYSWNCGAEGECDREDVVRLRRGQMRNFLTLLFLTQSTPLISAGDEMYNTQSGNNNPYCQDNETGWTNWDHTKTGEYFRSFVKKIIAFRKAHPVFTGVSPFKSTDYRGCGYPDLSLHGAEAWKPDLSHFSHAIGICLCENYVRGSEKTELIYLAINMHWEKQELGLPKLAPERRWNLVIDTALEESFMERECIEDDQHTVEVEPRSIKILCAVTSDKPIKRRKKKETPKSVTKPSEELRDTQSQEKSNEKEQRKDHKGEIYGAPNDSIPPQISGNEGMLQRRTLQTGTDS